MGSIGMIKKPRFFTLEELLSSSTARQKSIENLPSWETVLRLNQLALFLDGLREAWGSAIIVKSGFRNDRLNSAVGGVPNSAHRTGWAADLVPANGRMEEFKVFIRKWLKDKAWDQCILESKGGTEWVHLGLYAPGGGQRRQIFALTA